MLSESSRKLPLLEDEYSGLDGAASRWTCSTSWHHLSLPFLEGQDSLVFPETCKPKILSQNYSWSFSGAYECILLLNRLIFCLFRVLGVTNAVVAG